MSAFPISSTPSSAPVSRFPTNARQAVTQDALTEKDDSIAHAIEARSETSRSAQILRRDVSRDVDDKRFKSIRRISSMSIGAASGYASTRALVGPSDGVAIASAHAAALACALLSASLMVSSSGVRVAGVPPRSAEALKRYEIGYLLAFTASIGIASGLVAHAGSRGKQMIFDANAPASLLIFMVQAARGIWHDVVVLKRKPMSLSHMAPVVMGLIASCGYFGIRWEQEATNTNQFFWHRLSTPLSPTALKMADEVTIASNPALCLVLIAPLFLKARQSKGARAHSQVSPLALSMALVGTGVGVVASLPQLLMQTRRLMKG